MSNGSAGVDAVLLDDRLHRRGHQRRLDLGRRPVGCAALTSAETPAECGLDIDVPAIAWKRLPGGPLSAVVCRLRRHAREHLDARSRDVRLDEVAGGPRDENEAITSACVALAMPCAQVAITPVWPLTKAGERVRALRVDRRQLVVVGLEVGTAATGCRGSSRPRRPARTLGPCRCGRYPALADHDLARRGTRGGGRRQSASSSTAGGERSSEHDRGRRRDAVGERDARDVERRAAVGGQVQRRVEQRGPVEAPTVVTHGPPWSEVPAPGPELPAEALTEIPALKASRNASSTGSV